MHQVVESAWQNCSRKFRTTFRLPDKIFLYHLSSASWQSWRVPSVAWLLGYVGVADAWFPQKFCLGALHGHSNATYSIKLLGVGRLHKRLQSCSWHLGCWTYQLNLDRFWTAQSMEALPWEVEFLVFFLEPFQSCHLCSSFSSDPPGSFGTGFCLIGAMQLPILTWSTIIRHKRGICYRAQKERIPFIYL